MCIAYYRHQYEMLSGINEQQLLSEFPAFLQAKILKVTVRDYLAKIPVFKGLSSAMLTALAAEVQIQTYLPNDFITNEGAPAKGLYIVRRGIVVVISADIVVFGDKAVRRYTFL
jgi:CRP-like cAMP-binding protein